MAPHISGIATRFHLHWFVFHTQNVDIRRHHNPTIGCDVSFAYVYDLLPGEKVQERVFPNQTKQGHEEGVQKSVGVSARKHTAIRSRDLPSADD